MKSKILKWGFITAGVFVLLFLALGIHLYYVTDNFYADQRSREQIQLSRIDFNQPVDSAEAGRIQSLIGSMDGVQKSYFNLKDNILVYSYAIGTQNAQNVYAKLMASGDYKAERFVVNQADMAKGCPAMHGDNSVKGLLLIYQKMFSIF